MNNLLHSIIVCWGKEETEKSFFPLLEDGVLLKQVGHCVTCVLHALCSSLLFPTPLPTTVSTVCLPFHFLFLEKSLSWNSRAPVTLTCVTGTTSDQLPL